MGLDLGLISFSRFQTLSFQFLLEKTGESPAHEICGQWSAATVGDMEILGGRCWSDKVGWQTKDDGLLGTWVTIKGVQILVSSHEVDQSEINQVLCTVRNCKL